MILASIMHLFICLKAFCRICLFPRNEDCLLSRIMKENVVIYNCQFRILTVPFYYKWVCIKKGSEKKAAFKDFLKERRICLQVKFMWFRLQNMLEHVSSLTDCNLNMYAIYWMQSVNITVFFSMIIVLCLYIYI